MGRRKTLLYGHQLDERMNIALGFPDYEKAAGILSASDFEIPKIDWNKIRNKVDHEIPQYAVKEIDFEFEAQLGFRVRRAIASHLSGELPEDEMSEATFLKKVKRIEGLAQSLTDEINELAELGTKLVVRPKPRDGLTSAENPENLYSQISGKTYEPTSECFFDYYSFRRVLDYYSNFSDQNGSFHSLMSSRFGRMHDYSLYETFVRRVVLAFWPTNFPMTVTIPTDTNPDYSSPIILVLEQLREQFNQIAATYPGFADLHEDWTYRQHARLVLKLRDEFKETDIFWTLNSMRKNDNDQSDFTEKES